MATAPAPDAAIGLDAGSNPYPGLRPFLPSEEHLFFGRDRQVDGMIDKLARARFLAVVGGSGSGKSSLVNCGLRPALGRGQMVQAGAHWKVAQFRPGNRPLRALAQALASAREAPSLDAGPFTPADFVETTLRSSPLGLIDAFDEAGYAPGTNLLVVADQFEELFRYQQAGGAGAESEAGEAGEDAKAFVNLLVEAAAQPGHPVYVVITMRSDFLGDCAQFFGLPEAINAGQFLVPRLTREERRRAITGPAALSGVTISPVLLTRLVNDVGDNPDQLSILQHALNRTWARWQAAGTPDEPIDLVHYESIGTMAHALDAHAEEALAELDAQGQTLCARIFKALTDRSTDARGTRRPTRMADLCAIVGASFDEVAAVLEVFRRPGRAFLMPPAGDPLDGDAVVDISHESLMRVWERLVGWVDAENESAQTYRRLADSARLHAQGTSGMLWDPALQVAIDWRVRERPTEAWGLRYDAGYAQAMAYLDESRDQRDRHRADLSRQRRNRLLLGSAGAALAVVLVVALGLFQLERSRSEALSQSVEVQRSGRLAFEALGARTAGRYDRALVLGAAAFEFQPNTETRDALLDLMGSAPRLLLHGHAEQSILGLAFAPDGSTLTAVTLYGRVLQWNPANGSLMAQQELAPARESPRPLTRAAFSGSVDRVIVDGDASDIAVRVDLRSGQKEILTAASETVRQSILRMAFHVESGQVAYADFDYVITVRRIGATEPLTVIRDHHQDIVALAFSPDGRWLVSADRGGRLQLQNFERTRGSRPLVLESGAAAPVASLAFSPDGRHLAILAKNRAFTLWELPSGRRVHAEPGLPGDMGPDLDGHAVFSPDGRYVAWTGHHGRAEVLDLSRADERDRRQSVRGGPRAQFERLAFQPGGRLLAAADVDGSVFLWDLIDRKSLLPTLRGHAQRLSAMVFSPDGLSLATAAQPGERPVGVGPVALWNLSPGRVRNGPHARALEAVRAVAFSPDGRRLAYASEDSTVALLPVGAVADPARSLTALGLGALQTVAFSGDGRLAGAGSTEGQVVVWDVKGTDTAPVWLQQVHQGPVTGLAFTRRGPALLATASTDGTVKLYEPTQGRLLRTLEHEDSVLALALSPGGEWLAAGTRKGKVKLWHLAGADAADPVPGYVLEAHGDQAVQGLAFSDDASRLVSAGFDDRIRLWRVERREPIGQPIALSTRVLAIALTRDGQRLAAGDDVGRITLWDPQSGHPLADPMTVHDNEIYGLDFSPDGRLLASGGVDLRVALWDIDLSTWCRRACAMANRDLAEGDLPPALKSLFPSLTACQAGRCRPGQ